MKRKFQHYTLKAIYYVIMPAYALAVIGGLSKVIYILLTVPSSEFLF